MFKWKLQKDIYFRHVERVAKLPNSTLNAKLIVLKKCKQEIHNYNIICFEIEIYIGRVNATVVDHQPFLYTRVSHFILLL